MIFFVVLFPKNKVTATPMIARMQRMMRTIIRRSVMKFLVKYFTYFIVRYEVDSIWLSFSSIFMILSFCFCSSSSISGAI